MLAFDPDERISVQEALRHPYFASGSSGGGAVWCAWVCAAAGVGHDDGGCAASLKRSGL